MRVFAERQVIPTIYAVGMALERNPQAAETMARHGCDIVDHGWRWLDYHGIDEATEREHIRLSVETIRRLTGTRPIGRYIGTPSANTRHLVIEEGGFLYDSDAYNDELPYWTYDYGRPHLIIPHTLDDNDTRLARGLGWAQAEDKTEIADQLKGTMSFDTEKTGYSAFEIGGSAISKMFAGR
jgi:peptidoglycan/xylan/chitin deacetylase (PgdA/CDA1 family)